MHIYPTLARPNDLTDVMGDHAFKQYTLHIWVGSNEGSIWVIVTRAQTSTQNGDTMHCIQQRVDIIIPCYLLMGRENCEPTSREEEFAEKKGGERGWHRQTKRPDVDMAELEVVLNFQNM